MPERLNVHLWLLNCLIYVEQQKQKAANATASQLQPPFHLHICLLNLENRPGIRPNVQHFLTTDDSTAHSDTKAALRPFHKQYCNLLVYGIYITSSE